jgi:DNA-binding transcriptional LysR family regulator
MQTPVDWDLLRSFLAVARAGKLTGAARNLKINHATLSRRVAALEAALNTKLFDRQISGYVLTAQGQRLLGRAEEMERSVFAIQADVADEGTEVSGTVRIGAPEGFGTHFLAARIGMLARAHPDLFVELVPMPRSFSLSKREADIVIGLSQPAQGRLHTRKLSDYELGVYGARHRSEDWSRLRNRNDVVRHPFIGYIDDLIYAPELDYLPALSRAIEPQIRSSSILAQMEATCTGAGIAILPCFLAEPEPRLIRILPDELSLIRTFWMMIDSGLRRLPHIGATADFLARQVQQSRAILLPRHGTAR